MLTAQERIERRRASVKRHYLKNPVYRANLRQSAKRWRLNNLEWAQFTNRLRNYGLTVDQYHAKVEAQDECCAICGDNLPKSPDIDHDHETMRVRGLLCGGCNSGIGYFRENPTALRSAAKYLERWV